MGTASQSYLLLPPSRRMEVGAAVIGVAGAIGAAKASTSSGFSGRHEATYDSLVSQNREAVTRYRNASQSSQISLNDEKEYEVLRDDSRENLNQYYDSINAYKDESWRRTRSKLQKRKEVRKRKRAARDSIRSMSNHVDSASEGSDASSIYAESGSPPGSALEQERVNDWMDEVDEACTTESLLAETLDSTVKWSLEELQMLVEGHCKYAEDWSSVQQDPDYNRLGRHTHYELGEKWVELCSAFNEHCRDTTIHTMMPDRPFMFHPKTASHAWRPFTEREDRALLERKGSVWEAAIEHPVFQEAGRHEEELRMRWERDFFRKTLLSSESRWIYMLYEAVWEEWSLLDTQIFVEAYYRCGRKWRSILNNPAYKFGDNRSFYELDEKRAELCDAFRRHCRDRTMRRMLPDRRFLFQPETVLHAWQPFTEIEDDALHAGFEAHGSQWAVIIQDPVFQHRHEDELLMRWERDFFRKAFLSNQGHQQYMLYEAARKEWSDMHTQMLVEAYYKYGKRWSAILEDTSYKFGNSRSPSELDEKWADLCDAFSKHCRDTKVLVMLPDRPFLLHPRTSSHAWRPFTLAEDYALQTGIEAHGTEWSVIIKDPVFKQAGRRDVELLMRWKRDFFRNMLLSSKGRDLYETGPSKMPQNV